MALKCGYCGYVWEPRVMTPKSCPGCKRIFNDKVKYEQVDNMVTREYIRKAPVGELTDKTPGYSYRQCGTCSRLNRDVEAMYKWMGKNYCLEHFIAIVIEYDRDCEYSRPDMGGEYERERLRVRTMFQDTLDKLGRG